MLLSQDNEHERLLMGNSQTLSIQEQKNNYIEKIKYSFTKFENHFNSL